ncbi:MAG TPA: nucleotide exchange factor GrpE [Gemmatimonadales bacterium]|nr:nucleotide exchange factor GrpE [Gemmatimonadales bacterium]
MAKNPRYSGDPETGTEPIHTPGGMAEPAAGTGPSADGADIASTDMDANVAATGERAANYGAATGAAGPDAAADRLERELADAKDKHLRLAAEFDNYRKRVVRERAELSERAQAAFITRLLDVLDDLDRLVASDPESTSADALRDALLLVDKKLRKELEAAGVERIDPVDEPFNPSQHEAVSTIPAPTPDRDHTVSATFQPGYRFKGQLVRPARVQVYSSQGGG